MFDHLQIYSTRERTLVGCADAVLGIAGPALRFVQPAAASGLPRSILFLRLERIGDLLMTLGPLDTLRARAPEAKIHLVVGRWNADVAALITSVDSWESLDAPWLARGSSADAPATLARRASRWRERRFDLALNAEPDIRSNTLLALSGARRRVGFRSGGGGSLLTDALDYDPRAHTSDNISRLIDTALPVSGEHRDAPAHARLRIPDDARREAQRLLGDVSEATMRIGVHVSGGRPVKQWALERFAEAATRLAREHRAAIVLTGTADDRTLTDRVAGLMPADVRRLNLAGTMTLPVFGGLLESMDLLVTGDTGPMHLAAAVGTPLVAIFGPSDPARYGPLSARARIVTADLWCRPCNRVRLPPARCSRGTPDCLALITVDMVVDAARATLSDARR